nr:hypothetical protein [Bifidobacterium callitrichos]
MHTPFQRAAQRDEFRIIGRAALGVERFDELGHHAASPASVLLAVAADDPLVDAVREPQRRVGGIVEQPGGPLPLFVGPQTLGLQQDASPPVQRVMVSAASSGPLALEPASHGGELVAGEFDDVERVQHLHSVRYLTTGGLLITGKRVHGDDLHMVAERLWPFGEPPGERLLAPALDHIQQAGRPILSPRCQVDDHGHIPATMPGVPPYVLVHADRVDTIEPLRIRDESFHTPGY